jgi:hypothetical protein
MAKLKPETKRVLEREAGELAAKIRSAQQELDTAERIYLEKKDIVQDLKKRKIDLDDDLQDPTP